MILLGTGEKAFYERHKEMFLHDSDGRPMDSWCGWYALDPTHPSIRAVYRKFQKRWPSHSS